MLNMPGISSTGIDWVPPQFTAGRTMRPRCRCGPSMTRSRGMASRTSASCCSSVPSRSTTSRCGILCHGKSMTVPRPFARWPAFRRRCAHSAHGGKGLRSVFGRQMICTLLNLTCAGCCTFNTRVPDLAFTSLTRPAPSELHDANAPENLWRLQFAPGLLRLRFSTTRDLFRLQERNGAVGASFAMTLCDDRYGLVSIGRCYTDDGWTIDNTIYNNGQTKDSHFPPTPLLRRAADGRITYEASIRLESVMHDVIDPRFGGHTGQFTPLPSDPHRFPNLCFSIGGGLLTSFWRSNTVVLPRDAIIRLLGSSQPDGDAE